MVWHIELVSLSQNLYRRVDSFMAILEGVGSGNFEFPSLFPVIIDFCILVSNIPYQNLTQLAGDESIFAVWDSW